MEYTNLIWRDGQPYSVLFDDERGWQHNSTLNDATGFFQSSNLQKTSVPSNTTTDLRVFSIPADSSAIVTSSAVWRKTNSADTNTYEISYFVERDGSGAPTVTQFRRDQAEDIAGQNLLFAASGNDLALQFVAAAGEPGYVFFEYKVICIVEQGT